MASYVDQTTIAGPAIEAQMSNLFDPISSGGIAINIGDNGQATFQILYPIYNELGYTLSNNGQTLSTGPGSIVGQSSYTLASSNGQPYVAFTGGTPGGAEYSQGNYPLGGLRPGQYTGEAVVGYMDTLKAFGGGTQYKGLIQGNNGLFDKLDAILSNPIAIAELAAAFSIPALAEYLAPSLTPLIAEATGVTLTAAQSQIAITATLSAAEQIATGVPTQKALQNAAISALISGASPEVAQTIYNGGKGLITSPTVINAIVSGGASAVTALAKGATVEQALQDAGAAVAASGIQTGSAYIAGQQGVTPDKLITNILSGATQGYLQAGGNTFTALAGAASGAGRNSDDTLIASKDPSGKTIYYDAKTGNIYNWDGSYNADASKQINQYFQGEKTILAQLNPQQVSALATSSNPAAESIYDVIINKLGEGEAILQDLQKLGTPNLPTLEDIIKVTEEGKLGMGPLMDAIAEATQAAKSNPQSLQKMSGILDTFLTNAGKFAGSSVISMPQFLVLGELLQSLPAGDPNEIQQVLNKYNNLPPTIDSGGPVIDLGTVTITAQRLPTNESIVVTTDPSTVSQGYIDALVMGSDGVLKFQKVPTNTNKGDTVGVNTNTGAITNITQTTNTAPNVNTTPTTTGTTPSTTPSPKIIPSEIGGVDVNPSSEPIDAPAPAPVTAPTTTPTPVTTPTPTLTPSPSTTPTEPPTGTPSVTPTTTTGGGTPPISTTGNPPPTTITPPVEPPTSVTPPVEPPTTTTTTPPPTTPPPTETNLPPPKYTPNLFIEGLVPRDTGLRTGLSIVPQGLTGQTQGLGGGAAGGVSVESDQPQKAVWNVQSLKLQPGAQEEETKDYGNLSTALGI